MAKPERKTEDGTLVPGFTLGLGTRIAELYASVGGQGRAADMVGVTGEQAGKWKGGKARMPLHAAITLCQAAGKSLDWLATGEEPLAAASDGGQPLDEGLLRDVVEAVEEHLEANSVVIPTTKKALLIVHLYMIMIEGEEEVSTSADLISRFIKVAT